MSTQPILIDNVAFAKRREHLTGDLSLADCARLAELLQAQALGKSKSDGQVAGGIHYTLDGEVDSVGQHFLHLAVTSDLTAICQRCLESMPLKLDLQFVYLIASHEIDDKEAEESDDFDIQEANQAMDLLALIEDELIMAMPIAPAHKGECGSGVKHSGEKPNPFAVLKGLVKS